MEPLVSVLIYIYIVFARNGATGQCANIINGGERKLIVQRKIHNAHYAENKGKIR